MPRQKHPVTPDGRYFVVRGRLWRMSDPALDPGHRAALVADLMRARSALGRARRAHDPAAAARAREAIHRAKVALGERGPPWWGDGAPDYNRRMVHDTPYAGWYEQLEEASGSRE